MEEATRKQQPSSLRMDLSHLERALVSQAQTEPSARILEKMITDFSGKIAELIEGVASASQQFGIDQEAMLDYASEGLVAVVDNVRRQRDLMGHLMQIIKSCRAGKGEGAQLSTLGSTHVLSYEDRAVKFSKDDLQKLNNCSHPVDSLFVRDMDELIALILTYKCTVDSDTVELF